MQIRDPRFIGIVWLNNFFAKIEVSSIYLILLRAWKVLLFLRLHGFYSCFLACLTMVAEVLAQVISLHTLFVSTINKDKLLIMGDKS